MGLMPRLSFTFLAFLFLFLFSQKIKQIKQIKTHPRDTHFHFPPFSSQTHFLPPTVTWFSPTGIGVTLFFLFSVCIEMEGQEDPDPTNPSAKDLPLCDECKAMARGGGVEVLDAGYNTTTPFRHCWIRTRQSSTTVLGLRRSAPPPP
jgi:hypothetical protein